MVAAHDIFAVIDDIAAAHHPEAVVLFGSYSRGEGTADSDVDLLIVKPYLGAAYREATRIRASLNRTFAMDLVVRSPQEIVDRSKMDSAFLSGIFEQGIVLYDFRNL